MCKTPELAAQVTLMPFRRLSLDAAIIFADILLPLEPMGIELEFAKGKGPVIHNPPATSRDIAQLKVVDAEHALPFLKKAINLVSQQLPDDIPLIGFSGAPFTLACYAIEAGGTHTYLKTKSMMYGANSSWHLLMERISDVIISYLQSQIDAGVDAVQIFDSWAGALSPGDYREFVLPHSQRIFQALPPGLPAIHFATGSSGILEIMREAGGSVIGVDWRTALGKAWERLGYDVAIQGNLDPAVLLAPPERIVQEVESILTAADNRPGHIFNLGHGVLPQTPEAHVAVLVDAVHRLSKH
jgi:uroporphyrinogen decarboxylase